MLDGVHWREEELTERKKERKKERERVCVCVCVSERENMKIEEASIYFLSFYDFLNPGRHRMKGERTLWLPGCDHAGIATQVE